MGRQGSDDEQAVNAKQEYEQRKALHNMLKPKCGNCHAKELIPGNGAKVWCHKNPPTVFVTIVPTSSLQGLPGGGGVTKNYESAFPPMDKDRGWCCAWEPDEETEKLIRKEAKAEAARVIDERQRGLADRQAAEELARA